MNSSSAISFADRAAEHLRTWILPFWLENMRDPRGGFYGEITGAMQRNDAGIRGALLSSRVLWTFSAAYRRFPQSEYLAMARHAWSDLMNRFWDGDHEGFFWAIAADGTPQRTRKQIYGQAFAIYALTEYHRVTGEPGPRETAIAVFRRIERHARDHMHAGYFEACTRDWQLERDWRLSPLEMNTPKSQNTLLHVMESYTNLLRVWPDVELRSAQAALIEVMLSRVLNHRTHHLGLFFERDWTSCSGRISFGHDIEAAWLLTEAARVLGDEALIARTRAAAVRIAEVTQAEAVVGFIDAYQISGDTRWMRAAERVWEFIETRLVDREHGEWFRAVTRAGEPIREAEKAGFWKCPYHNGRACLEIYDRLRSVGTAEFSSQRSAID